MANFTESELDTLRRVYLRDLATAGPPAEYLSNFNKATRLPWASDAELQAMKEIVEREAAPALADLEAEALEIREMEGDDAVTAAATAAASRLHATFRLVRAMVREGQLADAGFLGSLADQTTRQEIISAYTAQILADRNHVRARSGPIYSSVPMDRR